MKFCKRCGSLLIPTKNKKGEVTLTCRSCGFEDTAKGVEEIKLKEKISVNNEEKIRIVENETTSYPVTDITCEKCGHNKAEWWTRQTRSSDEPETRFYRCVECKNTWREYS